MNKVEKCIFCFLRIEVGMFMVCFEICIGCMCYLGVLLYDVDWVYEVVLVVDEKDLYEK